MSRCRKCGALRVGWGEDISPGLYSNEKPVKCVLCKKWLKKLSEDVS
jgi:hypothetical protein